VRDFRRSGRYRRPEKGLLSRTALAWPLLFRTMTLASI